MAPDDKSAIDIIVDSTISWPTSHNMPMPVTPESIRLAIDNAHELGLQVAQSSGDEAYRRLQAEAEVKLNGDVLLQPDG